MSQAKIISQEDNVAVIEFTVPLDRIETELKKIYQKAAGSQKIAGFRPGKAPPHIIDQMFGKEGIHAQALETILPDSYMEALIELNITPVSAPEFDPWPSIEEGKDMVVQLKVELLPEFELPDITSIEVDLERKVDAKPDEIDTTILNMRKSKAEYKEADRPAKENDRVSLDYSLKLIDITGKKPETEYDARDGLQIHLGDEEILPDIEKNLAGLKAGEEKDFIVKYPDNYQNDDLKNQSVSVHVKLHKVEERVLPELDEDFCNKAAGAKTVDELRQKVEANLINYKTRILHNALRERVTAHVLDCTGVQAPEKLVVEEVDSRVEYLRNLIEQNPDPNAPSFEDMLEMKGLTEEKLREEETQAARVKIKRQIVFDRIFTQEKLQVTGDDMSLALAQYAVENGLKKSDLKKLAKNRDMMDTFRTEIKNNKVMELLALRAKFKDDPAAEPAEEKPAEAAADAPIDAPIDAPAPAEAPAIEEQQGESQS